MRPPRHLWSGDWQDESSALTDDLAARRVHTPEPAKIDEPAAPAPRRPRRSLAAMASAWLARVAGNRRLRFGIVAAALAVVIGGAAYAGVSALVNPADNSSGTLNGSVSSPGTPVSTSPAWLGIDMSTSPRGGVTVDKVFPGSPAEAAGIKPGDVITEIDTQPIVTPATVTAAIAGLAPGDQIDIQAQRGGTTYTAHVTLAGRPAGHP